MRNRTPRRGLLAMAGSLAVAFSLFALIGAGAAGATTIGPDSYGYTATSTGESLRTLDGSATTLGVGDDQVQGVSIGFPFSFYGNDYTTAYVSSNGFISFDAATQQGCCSGQPLPVTGGYYVRDIVAGLWTDLCPGTGYSDYYCYGTIRTQTLGSAPNREFVADYDVVSYCCYLPGPRVKFQIILHETTNAIELQYGQMDADVYSRTQSVGLSNADNSVGLQVAYGNVAESIAHGGWLISSGPTDTEAPVATPTQAPAANAAGWNSGDVTVSWNWADEDGGSGIDAGACTTTSVSSGEGTIALSATCADVAGNSGTDSATVQVDSSAPAVAFSGNAGTYTVDDTVTIGCSATDAVSGIASSTCPTVSASAVSLGLGAHTLTATATDEAGNTTTVTATFTVVLNASGLCALVHQLSSSEDVADGLCDKIRQIAAASAAGKTKVASNVLGALGNQLRAQTGKALTAAEAALIAGLAAQL